MQVTRAPARLGWRWVTEGFTLLRGMYNPGRLLELAALLLIFVIAVLLRQIRDAVGARGT